ncbi:hypothetical protein [Geothrix sp. SG200]|uniref:hypothetical protein n=1 Tax=Geothrix sp. SG200 TaxID=2922865 RepID=UPI001FABDBDD|nr:hypothetical protein [Geothrix sp. SG200]
MFTRRQRKPPKGGHRSELVRLMDEAKAGLEAHGTVRMEARRWVEAANLYLTLQRCCRAVGPEETPPWLVEHLVAEFGWVPRWEDEALVLELPGWKAPAPWIVAVQPSLFD